MTTPSVSVAARLPRGWYVAPPAGSRRWEDFVSAVVALMRARGVDENRVRREFTRVASHIETVGPERRWLLMTSEGLVPPTPVVLALGSVRLVAHAEPVSERDDRGGSVGPARPTLGMTTATIGPFEAVVRHELLSVPDTTVRERVTVVGSAPQLGLGLLAEVSTSDISAFADLIATTIEVLASLRWDVT